METLLLDLYHHAETISIVLTRILVVSLVLAQNMHTGSAMNQKIHYSISGYTVLAILTLYMTEASVGWWVALCLLSSIKCKLH